MFAPPLNAGVALFLSAAYAGHSYWMSGFAAGLGVALFCNWLADYLKSKRV